MHVRHLRRCTSHTPKNPLISSLLFHDSDTFITTNRKRLNLHMRATSGDLEFEGSVDESWPKGAFCVEESGYTEKEISILHCMRDRDEDLNHVAYWSEVQVWYKTGGPTESPEEYWHAWSDGDALFRKIIENLKVPDQTTIRYLPASLDRGMSPTDERGKSERTVEIQYEWRLPASPGIVSDLDSLEERSNGDGRTSNAIRIFSRSDLSKYDATSSPGFAATLRLNCQATFYFLPSTGGKKVSRETRRELGQNSSMEG